MKRAVVGILAHVDAGKTTLAEAMLYKTGVIRKQGRVDNGDTAMDTHTLEKERGITIFAGQSTIRLGDTEITLLDTPGHVDFSGETERMMKVLDYAILVISGTDGVQAHTVTLRKLLEAYNIPTFVFVTKMDYARLTQEEIMADLNKHCGNCVNFSSSDIDNRNESIAVSDESILEKYFESGSISDEDISRLIRTRKITPCYFGSGLKLEGIDEFLSQLEKYILVKN